METAEDREERLLIAKMDPMIVLQYINVSIDVIINLKFEDIENKMAESAVRRMDGGKKNSGRAHEDNPGRKQVTREKKLAGDSLVEASDNEKKEGRGGRARDENQEIEVADQLEDLVVEDTPQQIREKVQKIGKPGAKQGEREKARDATVIIKKSKTETQSAIGPDDRIGITESERASLSKYSMKSLQPMQSVRATAGQDEQASSIDDAPSCPRIYEEIIQQLEADVRKHIRIEH